MVVGYEFSIYFSFMIEVVYLHALEDLLVEEFFAEALRHHLIEQVKVYLPLVIILLALIVSVPL